MLEPLKRLFSRPVPGRDLSEMAQWAQRRGHAFKRARGHDGFVVDGLLDGKPWRMEWGESQRPYIEGHELRLRMELALPSGMQMLLMSRPLMDALERQTFEEFTDHVQTTIGAKAPEEMRWLVMFPKVDLTTLKPLRARFGAVASVPASALSWLEGPLANQVQDAAQGLLSDDPPFVLLTLRGRTYLRVALASPDPADIAAALAVFETAVTQALRVAASEADSTLTPPTTPSSPSAPGGGKLVGKANSGADWNAPDSTAWQTLQSDPATIPPKRR
jgi:hypothetical protein